MSDLKAEAKFLHDMATPLMVALHSVERVAAEATLAPPQTEHIKRAQEALEKMSQLLDDRREVFSGG